MKKTLVMVLTTERKAKRILDAAPDDADVFSGEVEERYFDSPQYAQAMGAKAGSGIYLERAKKVQEAMRMADADKATEDSETSEGRAPEAV